MADSRPEPNNAIVHFYRATVMHADIWRQRLDATTNWTVVTNAAIISFSFSQPNAPPFILLLLLVFDGVFLLMESRRYQVYDLWRRRIRVLNRYVFGPELSETARPSEAEAASALARLAADLGRTVPPLHLVDAIGYRLRRNYGYIALVSILAWLLKLWVHPTTTDEFHVVVERASLGPVAGEVSFLIVGLLVLFLIWLALRAPSERMVEWVEVPSPLGRLWSHRFFFRPAADEEMDDTPDVVLASEAPEEDDVYGVLDMDEEKEGGAADEEEDTDDAAEGRDEDDEER